MRSLLVLVALLVTTAVAEAALDQARIRATSEARRLIANADWDYSGRIDARDSSFVRPGRVTWAQALLRAAKKKRIGDGRVLDELQVRRFVLLHAGGDRILDGVEQIMLTRSLNQEYGSQGPQEPSGPPRKALSLTEGARMLLYEADVNHNGVVDSGDDPEGDYDPQRSFAGGLLAYANRHGVGSARKLARADLTRIVRTFAGPDSTLSPRERARLFRTIRPA